MPPILPTTPSPTTFATGWTRKFEEVVKTAAGRDGRLSITEAKRIAERTDGGRLFSDNAVGYLNAHRQQSVSAQKLIDAGRAYATSQGNKVAGPDGRISYADAARMRPDLRDDFLYLRGKIVDGPQRTTAQLQADVRDVVLRAFDNGTAKKLSAPPAVVRGRNELISHLPHEPSVTNLRTWVADGRIYVSRAANRPTPLVGWYDVGPVPVKSNMSDLRARFDSATKDLWLTSESDAKVKFIASSTGVSGAVTPALVKKTFGATHDALGPAIYGSVDPNFVKLADRGQVTEMNGYAWLEDRAEVSDPDDPVAVETAARWRTLANLVRSELTDVKVIRFGEVNITLMLVGQTKTGELAGFMSAVVET